MLLFFKFNWIVLWIISFENLAWNVTMLNEAWSIIWRMILSKSWCKWVKETNDEEEANVTPSFRTQCHRRCVVSVSNVVCWVFVFVPFLPRSTIDFCVFFTRKGNSNKIGCFIAFQPVWRSTVQSMYIVLYAFYFQSVHLLSFNMCLVFFSFVGRNCLRNIIVLFMLWETNNNCKNAVVIMKIVCLFYKWYLLFKCVNWSLSDDINDCGCDWCFELVFCAILQITPNNCKKKVVWADVFVFLFYFFYVSVFQLFVFCFVYLSTFNILIFS